MSGGNWTKKLDIFPYMSPFCVFVYVFGKIGWILFKSRIRMRIRAFNWTNRWEKIIKFSWSSSNLRVFVSVLFLLVLLLFKLFCLSYHLYKNKELPLQFDRLDVSNSQVKKNCWDSLTLMNYKNVWYSFSSKKKVIFSFLL